MRTELEKGARVHPFRFADARLKFNTKTAQPNIPTLIKRTVARSHRNAPRVCRALDARRASLATVATVC